MLVSFARLPLITKHKDREKNNNDVITEKKNVSLEEIAILNSVGVFRYVLPLTTIFT